MENYILKTRNDGSTISVGDVQLILLEALKDVDAICQAKGITYWLHGDSALGAIRHQGFIPWDYEASIGMLRQDYAKLVKALRAECDKSKYVVHCFDNHEDYNVLSPAMKIRRRHTFYKPVGKFTKNYICDDGRDSDGIGLNVYVYDHCANNRFLDLPLRLANQVLAPAIALGEQMKCHPVTLKKAFVRHAKLYGKMSQQSNYVGSDLTQVGCNPFDPFMMKQEVIFPVQYVDFEDVKLPVPHDSCRYLKMWAGENYMVLPPEEKRIPKPFVNIEL